MKDLKRITVVGLGFLGGSIASGVLRCFSGVKVVGYSHRPATRVRAGQLAVATKIVDSLEQSVCEADIVILATPISTFENIFEKIGAALPGRRISGRTSCSRIPKIPLRASTKSSLNCSNSEKQSTAKIESKLKSF